LKSSPVNHKYRKNGRVAWLDVKEITQSYSFSRPQMQYVPNRKTNKKVVKYRSELLATSKKNALKY
jgi:hypothetical protein